MNEVGGHVSRLEEALAVAATARERLEKALSEAHARQIEVLDQLDAIKRALRVALNGEAAALENLTHTQARCTELFVQNRRLRGIDDEIVCAQCKHTERLPPKHGEFNSELAIYRGWRQTAAGWICSKH